MLLAMILYRICTFPYRDSLESIASAGPVALVVACASHDCRAKQAGQVWR